MSENAKEQAGNGLGLRGGELLSALLLFFLCAGAWFLSGNFLNRSGLVQTLSPALFPRIVIATLAIAALGLVVRALLRGQDRTQLYWGHFGRVMLAAVVMFLQALIFDELGTLPSAWIGLVLLLLIAQVDWRKAVVVATGFLGFVYIFFILVLRVPLPMEFLPTTW